MLIKLKLKWKLIKLYNYCNWQGYTIKYQPNFTASINGCTVTIPANGQPYKVHNDFAVIILRRMRRLSENIDRMNRGESGQIYEIPNN